MRYYNRRTLHRSSLLLIASAALAFTAWAGVADSSASGPLFVSPAGNDMNNCQTFATACRTITVAVGKASAGDIIIIGSGVYTESVTLDKNLTLIGFGSDTTFISVGDINRVLENSAGISSNVYDVAIVRGSHQPLATRNYRGGRAANHRTVVAGQLADVA